MNYVSGEVGEEHHKICIHLTRYPNCLGLYHVFIPICPTHSKIKDNKIINLTSSQLKIIHKIGLKSYYKANLLLAQINES